MNVFGKRERTWRKARKRGVSPIIATILLVAITVVLAAVLYVLISSLTTGGANTVPIGTTLSLGAPQQSTSATQCGTTIGAGECYTISIQTAGSSATTGNIHFPVQRGGAPITKQPTLYLVEPVGTTVATWSAGAWSASAPFSTSAGPDSLVVSAASSVAGDSLVSIGVGGLSGSFPTALP